MKVNCLLKSLILSIFIIVFTHNQVMALADGVEIIGEKTVSITGKYANKTIAKKIKLQDVKLNNKFKSKLKFKLQNLTNKKQLYKAYKLMTSCQGNYCSKIVRKEFAVDLGMANVPVLDQGTHGTCVVFSTTAAIDAYQNAGDYISQQCLLELGKYLANNQNDLEYEISGWNGAAIDDILARVNKYGIVDNNTCPHKYADDSYELSPNEYATYSFNGQWKADFHWRQLFQIDEFDDEIPGSLDDIKKSLANGHRVVIGTFLLKNSIAGTAVNGKPNGLWTIPENTKIEDMVSKIAGAHAIIVTGFDDEQKLLKIRNSWGKDAGDEGEFYMSYDYFDAFVMDSFEIY